MFQISSDLLIDYLEVIEVHKLATSTTTSLDSDLVMVTSAATLPGISQQ